MSDEDVERDERRWDGELLMTTGTAVADAVRGWQLAIPRSSHFRLLRHTAFLNYRSPLCTELCGVLSAHFCIYYLQSQHDWDKYYYCSFLMRFLRS